MSLKAKLEAVIYAAEEPVTLTQLAGLFTDEALEWKAEQTAAAAAVLNASLAPPSLDPAGLPLLSEAFTFLELDVPAKQESPAQEENGTASDAGPDENQVPEEAATAEPGTEAVEEKEPEATDPATAAKLEKKQREREARGVIKQILGELITEYANDGRGIEIREIAGGYRMATKPEFHDAVRSFVKSLKPALKLSLPALETLAVIAYKQPVTAPEVNEIRGVDSSGVFGSLLARKLIATAGRKPVVGRPILYKTTREFLLRFGLKDVSELPSMEEFEKMAASELEEPETAQEASAEEGEKAEFNPDSSVEMAESEAVAPEAAASIEAESNSSDSTGGDRPPDSAE
jgi:segregation and condensation protein B